MRNQITEGKDRELPPDEHGEIRRAPTPALIDLHGEVKEASALKESGQGDAMRARSSIESRTDLRLAATNEAMRADPVRPASTLVVEVETARRWADLDAVDFGRIRSDSRRENALEAIAGHMRASPEYADELKKRSPTLADAARTINDERGKFEHQIASPSIDRNAATLAIRGPAPLEAEQRDLAKQDAQSLAVLPEGAERHSAAVTIGENARTHLAYRDELQRSAPQVAREAEAAAADRGALRAVDRRNDELMVVPRDALSVKDAREAVTADVEALNTIKDQSTRYMAAVAISDNIQNQANYRAEIQIQAPEIAKEAHVAGVENNRRIAEKENRKAEEHAAMQLAKVERAAGWSPEQAADQVKKDTASLSKADATERYYLLGDMAVAIQHSKAYSEALTKTAPETSREVEARREQDAAEKAAADQRRENIGAAAQSRSALIDAAALAAVAAVRSRETARVVEQLASSPDTATQQLRDAQQALKAPPFDGRVTAPNDPDIAAQQLRVLKRPIAEQELSEVLTSRFIVSHEKRGLLDKGPTEFTFKAGEQQGRVAFRDVGKSLRTDLEDKAIIRAMVEVAATKNWQEITVSGTDDFRRNAWLEASLNNMKVKGYEPRVADLKILADLQKDAPKAGVRHAGENTITVVDRESQRTLPVEPQAPSKAAQKHIDGDALTRHEKAVMDNSRSLLTSQDLGDKFTQAALLELESKLRGERVYVGELVGHGKAPYKFDKKNDDSYYVTLKTPAGEQVIWGKGLVEAMQDRKKGDEIVLQNVGRRDVTVQEHVRDDKGAVLTVRPKDSHLNSWTSELLSQVTERAKADFANRAGDRQPSLGVYDPKAERTTPSQPAVEREPKSPQRNQEAQRNSRDR